MGRAAAPAQTAAQREVRPAGGTAAAEFLKQSESKAWRSQEELFMWRGCVSRSKIALGLLLKPFFQADLSLLIWSSLLLH